MVRARPSTAGTYENRRSRASTGVQTQHSEQGSGRGDTKGYPETKTSR